MQCTNNLKQMAIACHNYHDVHLKFCPGNNWMENIANTDTSACAFACMQPGGEKIYCGMIGWPAFLLPFMEGTSTYSIIDFTTNAYTEHVGFHWGNHDGADACGDSTNTNKVTASKSTPSALMCPSTPTHDPGQKDYGANGWNAYPERTLKSDVTNHATHAADSGVFWANSGLGMEAIIDGTSHTFLFLERSHVSRFLTITEPTTYGSDQYGNPFFFVNHAGQGYVTATWCNVRDLPINKVNESENMRYAHGWHPGGINAALADGSVIFVSDTINFYVYGATCNINKAGYPSPGGCPGYCGGSATADTVR